MLRRWNRIVLKVLTWRRQKWWNLALLHTTTTRNRRASRRNSRRSTRGGRRLAGEEPTSTQLGPSSRFAAGGWTTFRSRRRARRSRASCPVAERGVDLGRSAMRGGDEAIRACVTSCGAERWSDARAGASEALWRRPARPSSRRSPRASTSPQRILTRRSRRPACSPVRD